VYVDTANIIAVEGEDFLLALEDLTALADSLSARANALSVVPEGSGGGRAAQAREAFLALSPAEQTRLAVSVAVLRAPGRMAHWNHSIADETVSRAALAWSSSMPDTIVALAGTVDPRRISFWTQASVAASIRKVLAAEGPVSDGPIGCKVSTQAVIVFLGILDHLRAARLHSQLAHAAPPRSFCVEEVLIRLRDAAAEDFRWPLLFVEKLIPGRLVTSLTEVQVASALAELTGALLIEKAAEGKVPRFELTAMGGVIADGVLHDVSKVALGVTDRQSDGTFGRDIALLVRGTFHVFLFAMAGQTGAIAALSGEELAAVLHMTLRPAPPPVAVPEPAATAAPLPPAKQWYYTRDGEARGPVDEDSLFAALASLGPETPVWNPELPNWIPARTAGFAPLPSSPVCPRCQAPVEPGKRFCGFCGTPLT
jgi:hypothetical protein